MRQGALLWNPAAGSHRADRLAARLEATLRARGWELRRLRTECPGHATELARAAAQAGDVEAVFTLGGDGTQREVAAGLLGSDVALATLPAGTANVLARALGIPLRPLAAAAALADAPRRPLAVGLCGETPFLMMVSAGLDAAVVAVQGGAWKARLGRGAILAQGFGAWWRYGFPLVEARWDDRVETGSFVAVCNIPLYGGPFAMAPGACFDDDELDLVLLRSSGRAATLAFAGDLVRGRHLRRADVVSACVEEVRLAGAPGLPLQVDGDSCRETLPARVRVAPQRLQVLAPAPPVVAPRG